MPHQMTQHEHKLILIAFILNNTRKQMILF